MSDNNKILLPEKLTAENGAKALLSGEFKEIREVPNPDYCGCGDCSMCSYNPNEPEFITEEIPISWDNIKAIYNKIVEVYGKKDEKLSKPKN